MAPGVPRASAFAQFVRFGTDAYGLERLLRLFQALTQLLLALPVLHPIILSFDPTPYKSSPAIPTPEDLLLFSQTLTLLRRRLSGFRLPLRLLRFLDTLPSAWSAWPDGRLEASRQQRGVSTSGGAGVELAAKTERWLTFASRSFNGMYQLLESLTFVDLALGVPGLSVWGADRAAEMAMDGQRFWFASLVCAVVAGGLKLVVKGRLSWGGVEGGRGHEKGSGEKDKKKVDEGNKILRRVVADLMDLAVPGSVVGWVPFGPAKVALFMFGSTVLTGMEVWERCGRETASAKAAANGAS